ncbi:MAG: nucleotide sugar dehydrogenase, partial [Anderseniella sp.]
ADHEYGVTLCGEADLQGLDAVILAVNHQAYLEDVPGLMSRIRKGGLLIDVKSAIAPDKVREDIGYWSL